MIDTELLRRTKGFLDHREGSRLYELALETSVQAACLEIGSYCGLSTLYLGGACRVNRQILFSVDHHRGSEEQQPGQIYFDPNLFDPHTRCVDTLGEFRRTLAAGNLEETVVPMVCTSAVAARAWSIPLGLVFIDGGHSRECVYTDYLGWAGHIRPGGYLLMHDIFTDPTQGGQAPYEIYRLALASGLFDELPLVGTLGVLRRRLAAGDMGDA